VNLYQRILLRLLARRASRGSVHRLLTSRTWTIEGGEGKGLKLQFPQNLEYISGTSELPVQRELARRLKPGDVFYDVGANMGFFSLIASRFVGPQGSICAFEPDPRNAAAIRENASLNGLHNLRLCQVALGATSRRAEFVVARWDGGGSLFEECTSPSDRADRTEVQVEPLVALIPAQKLPDPTFVKIDVEGAELEVLAGMTATISRCHPVLLYEIDDGDAVKFQRRWAELDALVAKLGYDVIHLENAYPTLKWNVGHSLALPRAGS
jgi:FkbM family methyltransferase